MGKDFYNILGISRDTSKDEIKNAYRKEAAKCHPDVFDEGDAGEKLKKVQEAKGMLTDDEKRQVYGQVSREHFQQSQGRGGGDGGHGQDNPFGNGDNPFGSMGSGGGGFEDIFNNLLSGSAGGQ